MTKLDDVRKDFRDRGIKKVKVGGFDVDGVLRGKYVSVEKFLSAAEKGMGFCDVIFGWDVADALLDDVKVTGWKTGYPDIEARIDLDTYRVTPWEPDTATFLLDFWTADGDPHPACPRNLLKSILARAQGHKIFFAAEYEFFVFTESPHSLREKGYRGLQPIFPGMFGYSWLREGQHRDFLHDLMDTLRTFDIEIEGLHTETGPGVFEAAIRYDEALRAADKAALFKTCVKQVAFHHNLSATFMAKWNADLPGSSGHLHQSLWDADGKRNVFADAKDPQGVSQTLKRWVGGQVALMPELTALVSPTVNSYKRYVPGVWAPLNATWGYDNRTGAIRVIRGPTAASTRIEHRQSAADMNPYVAMASMIAAGLHGVEKKIDPPPPLADDAAKSDAPRLPRTLREATALLASSKTARAILGEGFVDHYVRTREWECRQYEKSVSDWELARYFETV